MLIELGETGGLGAGLSLETAMQHAYDLFQAKRSIKLDRVSMVELPAA
jgi:hypothetical protein